MLGVLTSASWPLVLPARRLAEDARSAPRPPRRGLAVADKPDSHDICFIADGDTAGFLAGRLGRRAGDIVDTDGRKVGEHDGTHQFTIGQRRGLRLGVPADDGQPRYVLDISPVTNTVTVGPHEALAVDRSPPSGRPGPALVPTGALVAARSSCGPTARRAGRLPRSARRSESSAAWIAPAGGVAVRAGRRGPPAAAVVGSADDRRRPPREHRVTRRSDRRCGYGHRLLARDRHGRRDQDRLRRVPGSAVSARASGPGQPRAADRPVDRPAGRSGSRPAAGGLAADRWLWRDHRLAISPLRSDLDQLEEHAQGYAGR